ncbi:Cof-type HAD-IIB family hydrolase [Halalkalibacillus sediminis]|uniref:Cof-type HAD-IIB family hydrolase n=1 Tax=Halalkalibacillus sediminis TaxID=2018042 RepID=A0A2I0QR58_9BACI|nr:Cof-type HAD-IIB family hydrolase [Halalkalibacillus sediminis]PKR76813.1 Cof-type HAD-IIB family hydrolase [Halalkalibacillus sediminis]
MQKHIIFFDIDGTLLDQHKKLPASAKQAILDLQAKGHEVAIATGRAPFMYEELRKELGINTYVSFNGQYVVLDGEVIYTNPLNHESLESLTEMAHSNDHPVVYLDEEDMKANVPQHDHIDESIATLKLGQFPSYYPEYFRERSIYQSLLFCEKGEEKPYEEQFDHFDFIRWHPYSVDVIPAGGSKAEGIKKITDKLGIPSDRQVAFGDSLNDLEMLRDIEHSVAMGNGHDRAKEAAKYETDAVDNDGILKGLKKLGLL